MRKRLKKYNTNRYKRIIANRMLFEILAAGKELLCNKRLADRHGTYEVICMKSDIGMLIIDVYSKHNHKLLWTLTELSD